MTERPRLGRREYARLAAWGRTGGAIPDTSYHWWDVRLHPRLGTLELRVCDVQTELDDASLAVATQDGRRLTLDEGVTFALAALD